MGHLCLRCLLKKKARLSPNVRFFDTQKSRLNSNNPTFRQNNDIFRQMKFALWFISGVVKFSVFVIQTKKSYNCKKVMQVLTGQYPQIYVKKYRVFYTDFQPNATRRSILHLFDLPRAHQIVFSSYWCESQFLDGAGSDISVALWDENNVAAIGAATGNFSNFRVSLPSTSVNGGFQSTIPRTKPTTPTAQQLFCGFTSPTPIGLSVTMPVGRTVNQLTAGTVVVWVGYIRLT